MKESFGSQLLEAVSAPRSSPISGTVSRLIAYPWLASALTRNPLHIAAVAVVTRLPWLLFSLPAGVVTDRVDRRKLAAWMDLGRFLVTACVASGCADRPTRTEFPRPHRRRLGRTSSLSGHPARVIGLRAALLLGTAEVFRDNSAQTLMPAIVEKEHLEKANGRLWGAEMVMNSFVGPPVAGVLLAVGFALPFFVDAGTFAVAAALVFLIAGNVQTGATGNRLLMATPSGPR